MFAVLKFDRDLESEFEPTDEHSSKGVFKVNLHLPPEYSQVQSVPGWLRKRPYPSDGMDWNNFQWLLHWQNLIKEYKLHSQANTLAIAEIREISTNQVKQEIRQGERNIQNILLDIRSSSNSLVLASNQWWQNPIEAQHLRNKLYDHIIGFTNNRDLPDDSIFYLFIQTDHRAIQQLPWEQLIRQWLLNLFSTGHHNIFNLKLSVNFIPNNSQDLIYFSQEILLNQYNQVEVLAVIGSEVNLDSEDIQNNLDSILDRIQETNNKQSLNINITKVRFNKCDELACDKLANIIRNSNFDILVFIGHSDIKNDRAILQLSSDSQFSITRLNTALNEVNKNNSKHRLLIFNSCSSLGLAQDIVSEHNNISCIAYKEAITDKLALDFLTLFFKNFRDSENFSLSKVMMSTKRDFNLTSESNDFSMEVSWFPIIILPSIIQDGNKQIIPLIRIKHPETVVTSSNTNLTKKNVYISYTRRIINFLENITTLIKDFTPPEAQFTVFLRTIFGFLFGAILYLLQVEYLSFWSQFGIIFGFIVFLLGYFYLMGVRSISHNFKLILSLCPIIIASIVLAVLLNDNPENFKFDIILVIQLIACTLIAYLLPKVTNFFYR